MLPNLSALALVPPTGVDSAKRKWVWDERHSRYIKDPSLAPDDDDDPSADQTLRKNGPSRPHPPTSGPSP
jgi:hypothetical protein